MTSKTTTTTRKLSTLELITRLILLISTLVLVGIATVTSVKICYSQYRMFSYYVDIQRAEDCRDYNEDLSKSYHGPYMDFAASYDEKAKLLSNERNLYCSEASDPITIWSIRDGFDLLTAIIGILSAIFILVIWINLFKFLSKIVETEAWFLHLTTCKIMRRKCQGCCRRCPRNRNCY